MVTRISVNILFLSTEIDIYWHVETKIILNKIRLSAVIEPKFLLSWENTLSLPCLTAYPRDISLQ